MASAQFHLIASAFAGTICLPEKPVPIQNILDLHRAGKGEAAIARELGVTRWVVRRVIRNPSSDHTGPIRRGATIE